MIANLGVSIPVFVLGLLLAYIFAVVPAGHAVRPAAIGRLSAGVPFVASPRYGGSRT